MQSNSSGRARERRMSDLKIMKYVERWIKGFEGTSKIMIPLSIEGQVHYLIEVRSLDCMCLYVGFGLFFPRIRVAFPSGR